MVYAFDTNTVIHMMGNTPSVRKNREIAEKNAANFVIPPFVNYEILRGLMIKPVPKHEEAYGVVCENCAIGEMTANAWKQAAKIYAALYIKRLTVADSDIVIAAFCVANGYTLVTDNTADFANMEGLQTVNWVER